MSLNRRGWLAGGASLSAMLLSGCDKIAEDPNVVRGLAGAEGLNRGVQRLLGVLAAVLLQPAEVVGKLRRQGSAAVGFHQDPLADRGRRAGMGPALLWILPQRAAGRNAGWRRTAHTSPKRQRGRGGPLAGASGLWHRLSGPGGTIRAGSWWVGQAVILS